MRNKQKQESFNRRMNSLLNFIKEKGDSKRYALSFAFAEHLSEFIISHKENMLLGNYPLIGSLFEQNIIKNIFSYTCIYPLSIIDKIIESPELYTKNSFGDFDYSIRKFKLFNEIIEEKDNGIKTQKNYKKYQFKLQNNASGQEAIIQRTERIEGRLIEYCVKDFKNKSMEFSIKKKEYSKANIEYSPDLRFNCIFLANGVFQTLQFIQMEVDKNINQ